jgi:hypothetical protein
MTEPILAFLGSFLFLAARTLNVRAVVGNRLVVALASSTLIHFAWLWSIAFGAEGGRRVMEGEPGGWGIVLASLVGALTGQALVMKADEKKNEKVSKGVDSPGENGIVPPS